MPRLRRRNSRPLARRTLPHSPTFVPPNRDNEAVTDPSAKDGPLGIENESPEGGDSTRFTDEVRDLLKKIKVGKA